MRAATNALFGRLKRVMSFSLIWILLGQNWSERLVVFEPEVDEEKCSHESQEEQRLEANRVSQWRWKLSNIFF